MKKAKFIGTMMIYNFFIALILTDLSFTYTGTVTPDITTDTAFNVVDIFATLGQMTTFSVDGVQNWIIILFFYIPNIVLILAISGFIFNRDN